MSEMVERLAKAMFEREQQDPHVYRGNMLVFGVKGPVTWEFVTSERVNRGIADTVRKNARAALEELRQVDDAIATAAARALWDSYQRVGEPEHKFDELHPAVRTPWVNSAKMMLRAAIDEALK